MCVFLSFLIYENLGVCPVLSVFRNEKKTDVGNKTVAPLSFSLGENALDLISEIDITVAEQFRPFTVGKRIFKIYLRSVYREQLGDFRHSGNTERIKFVGCPANEILVFLHAADFYV